MEDTYEIVLPELHMSEAILIQDSLDATMWQSLGSAQQEIVGQFQVSPCSQQAFPSIQTKN